MTRTASEIIESYLSALRAELVAAGAADTDDLVAEIRSLLTEAGGGEPEATEAEVGRLGEPAELARGILVERGLDTAEGMSSGVWWRLGIAAPTDIAIGLAIPLAAAIPLFLVAWYGQPRAASIAVAVALGIAALAWPFFIWRPWRRGGRTLSPGMNLTGLAVVRAPGFWRLVRIDELDGMGLAPRRRILLSAVVALVATALLAGVAFVGLDVGGSLLAEMAMSTEFSEATVGSGVPLQTQLQSVVEQVYIGVMGVDGSAMSTSLSHVTPEASEDLESLWRRVRDTGIRSVRVVAPQQIAHGVYRFEVQEFAESGSPSSAMVGSSTFTVGRRQWLSENGVGSDWAVVSIEVGSSTAP